MNGSIVSQKVISGLWVILASAAVMLVFLLHRLAPQLWFLTYASYLGYGLFIAGCAVLLSAVGAPSVRFWLWPALGLAALGLLFKLILLGVNLAGIEGLYFLHRLSSTTPYALALAAFGFVMVELATAYGLTFGRRQAFRLVGLVLLLAVADALAGWHGGYGGLSHMGVWGGFLGAELILGVFTLLLIQAISSRAGWQKRVEKEQLQMQ